MSTIAASIRAQTPIREVLRKVAGNPSSSFTRFKSAAKAVKFQRYFRTKAVLASVLALVACTNDPTPGEVIFIEDWAGIVIADEPNATLVGEAILARNGTAGDAAAAMNVSKSFASELVGTLGERVTLLRNTHRFAGFAVLKSATVPSVLVEIGYMIRVAVSRVVAQAPDDCPNWSPLTFQEDIANGVGSNLGCSTAHNLSVMIADPHDLIEGRDGGPATSEPAVLGQERYRKGETKEFLEGTIVGIGGGG